MTRRNPSIALIGIILTLVIAGCGGRGATPQAAQATAVPPAGAATQAAQPTTVPPASAGQSATPTAALTHTLALPAVGEQTSPLASPLNSPVGAPTAAPATGTGRTLTVMTHDSFSASQDVIAKFEAQCGCKVTFLKSGDAGLALNKAILSKGNPLADVFYGVDNTFLSRALAADIFEPYASPALQQIPDQFKQDTSNRELPVDYGYVNLNYDKQYFSQHNLPIPKQLRDLADPQYKSLLVVENPATSSPGLAFLLTTISSFGESGSYTYQDFWKALRANDVLVVDGWESAYNEKFSAGPGKGDRPLVVSYATSPAAEVYYASPQPADSPTGNILPEGQTFEQVEFAGILKGAKNPDLARQWVDFMLGPTFQADIPLQMWVYPVRTGTALPDVFTKFAQEPAQPAHLTAEQIGAGRDKWIQAWTNTVLH